MKKVIFLTHKDSDLCRIAELIAFDLGAKWGLSGTEHNPSIYDRFIDEEKTLWHSPSRSRYDESIIFDLAPLKELTEKPETVELNGQKYLKSDLEEALKHIKPVE